MRAQISINTTRANALSSLRLQLLHDNDCARFIALAESWSHDCEGNPACLLGNDCIRHHPLTLFAGAMLDYEYAITSLNLITNPVIDVPNTSLPIASR